MNANAFSQSLLLAQAVGQTGGGLHRPLSIIGIVMFIVGFGLIIRGIRRLRRRETNAGITDLIVGIAIAAQPLILRTLLQPYSTSTYEPSDIF